MAVYFRLKVDVLDSVIFLCHHNQMHSSCDVTMIEELCLMKCKLSFIGHSGSNHSAFYLYRSHSVQFYSTSWSAHA